MRIAKLTLLLLALPALASAGPLKLRWDNCWGDGGVMNKTFACDVNTGQNALVASLVPDGSLHDIEDMESRIDTISPVAAFRYGGSARPAVAARAHSTWPRWLRSRRRADCRRRGDRRDRHLHAGAHRAATASIQIEAYPIRRWPTSRRARVLPVTVLIDHQKSVWPTACVRV
jgi:hypothetical protein